VIFFGSKCGDIIRYSRKRNIIIPKGKKLKFKKKRFGIFINFYTFTYTPEEVSGSIFKISSTGNEVSGTIENTGGYYTFKTKVIGRIHLRENSLANIEIQAVHLKSGSLMNLKKILLTPVSKQTLVN
jgi:hypothetical protein